MNVNSMKRHAGHLSVKLLFVLAVAACVALGVIGLVLPVIPGLLFLAIAAVLLAPHIPALNDWMTRSPSMRRYIEDAHNLRALSLQDQLRLGALLSLRMTLDGAKYVFGLISGLFDDFGRHSLRRAGSRRSYYDSAY